MLKEEVNRYNHLQVHSTTGEIPAIRFENAKSKGNSLFRPFSLPKPYTSLKDVFCFHDSRTLNGYRKISLAGQEYEIPKVDPRETVFLHLFLLDPDLVEIRVWFNNKLVHTLTLPLDKLRSVHF